MSRAVAADVKATGRDRTVITKAGKRFFFYGFRGNVRHFSLFQKGRYALFGLDFGAVPSFRATAFPRHRGCVFSLGRELLLLLLLPWCFPIRQVPFEQKESQEQEQQQQQEEIEGV